MAISLAGAEVSNSCCVVVFCNLSFIRISYTAVQRQRTKVAIQTLEWSGFAEFDIHFQVAENIVENTKFSPKLVHFALLGSSLAISASIF